jgi:L-seryl-tRNA(Ser) seleniumtransferase
LSFSFKSKKLEELGVRSWVNASNWATVYGGAWIDDRVLDAMNEVAKTFVDMHELILKAGERIAALCEVWEAHVTTGSGAAMGLAVAGCMAGEEYGKWMRLPDTVGMKNEVVSPRGHNIRYSPQWTAPGAKLVEYGEAGTLRSFAKELEASITERTCCLAYTISYNVVSRGIIPLEEVIEIGERYDVPVVIDAASMIPPVSNLHKYTDMGADIVCFSGGKAIKAPNNTGMLLANDRGSKIIKAIREHSFPNAGWGRGFKISKEQIVGLVTALEIFIDEGDALYEDQMRKAEYMAEKLGNIPGLEVSIIPNNEKHYEHIFSPKVPRVLFQWELEKIPITGVELDEALSKEDPPIYLRNSKYYNYFNDKQWRQIDTYFLRDEEVEIVLASIKKYLSK